MVDAGAAKSEFHELGLAQEHDARGKETASHRGVGRGDVVAQQGRAAGGGQPRDIHEVLKGEGNAVQGTEIGAGRDLRFGRTGLGARPLGCDGEIGVECRIVSLNAL